MPTNSTFCYRCGVRLDADALRCPNCQMATPTGLDRAAANTDSGQASLPVADGVDSQGDAPRQSTVEPPSSVEASHSLIYYWEKTSLSQNPFCNFIAKGALLLVCLGIVPLLLLADEYLLGREHYWWQYLLAPVLMILRGIWEVCEEK